MVLQDWILELILLIIRSSVVLWGGGGQSPHYTLGDLGEICWNIFYICCSDLYVTFLHVLHIIELQKLCKYVDKLYNTPYKPFCISDKPKL